MKRFAKNDKIFFQGKRICSKERESQTMVFDAVNLHKALLLYPGEFKSHIAGEQKDRIVPTEVESEETALLIFSRKLPTIKQATQLLVDEALRRR